MSIYKKYEDRAIHLPFDDERAQTVIDSIRRLTMACKENVLMLEEELKSNDPDLDERCGLLDNRFEVYAVAIPQCPRAKLALSIDFGDGSPPSVMLHGAVGAANACAAACRLAIWHRNLMNPTWEPRP
ncbi:hypothetical protein H2509_18205 [Stappia sp. F7233]|uniref:Uncharacterized protein n=1 Tax=Stappia albiluteola TaxID=2758565 RepID=A0A839AJ23_9HYPH|nr:hypothetical protein [Stappia albiluteola]MBA5779066.1 hypothetical protein [Stappia albiluteola]